MNKKTQIVLEIIIGAVIVIGGIGYYIYTDMLTVKNTIKKGEKTTKTVLPKGINIEGTGDYTVKITPIKTKNESVKVPNLDRKIVFTVNISVKTQNILKQKIEDISNKLKKDSNVSVNWIALGTYRKNIGDYDGALEAWNYAIYLSPSNSVVYNNIGDLYAYFLKDNVLAEKNLLKAIDVAPKDIYSYFKMSEFYVDILKNQSAARAIVKKGIKENPDSVELKSLFSSLR